MKHRPFAGTRIEIDAPIDVVWAVMLDLARYREWNPFVIDVQHAPKNVQVGSRFLLNVRWENGKELDSWETVTQIAPPQIIAATAAAQSGTPAKSALLEYQFSSWLATYGLVRATREQQLTQQAGQPTVYQTQEVFDGLLTRFLPLREVQNGFERHAQALKQRAEMLAAQHQ